MLLFMALVNPCFQEQTEIVVEQDVGASLVQSAQRQCEVW